MEATNTTSMMTLRALCLLIVSLLLPAAVQAVQVDGLYRTEVPVADQSALERKRATKRGLAEVLVKVTGRSTAASTPQVKDALNRADAYLSDYSYRHQPASADAPAQLWMAVNYSESQVGRLVRRAQLPIWPANRPEMLVWLVTDLPGEGRVHVGRELLPEAHDYLDQQMARRAEPLLVPLLDLEDQLTLSARDAWAFDADALSSAAARYNAEHWCVLRFFQTNSGKYRGAVQVEAGLHSDIESVDADSLQQLIDKTINWAVDRVAAGYAFVPLSNAHEVALLVENVGDYDTYKAALKRIEDKEMVTAVRVAAAEAGALDLRLQLDGSINKLRDSLRRDKRLTEIADLSADEMTLRFRWK